MQKLRSRTEKVVLLLIVNIWFQVLFHSPPGVLFTFPSRYYTLSVTRSYLALGDGPPSFTPDFTCPVLLWITLAFTLVSDTGLLPCFAWLSNQLLLPSFLALMGSEPPCHFWLGFGLLQFRSPLLSQSFFYFLFLQVLRCFSSLGSLHLVIDSPNDTVA